MNRNPKKTPMLQIRIDVVIIQILLETKGMVIIQILLETNGIVITQILSGSIVIIQKQEKIATARSVILEEVRQNFIRTRLTIIRIQMRGGILCIKGIYTRLVDRMNFVQLCLLQS